jgi:acyl-CoA thioester hydrolase
MAREAQQYARCAPRRYASQLERSTQRPRNPLSRAPLRGLALTPFVWRARVYWEDTDGGGIVYYANYLKFLERARTEWLRALGFSQDQLARDEGFVFTVVNLTVDYKRPARLDDELSITCVPKTTRAASIRFAQRVYRGAIPTNERGEFVTDTAAAENLLIEAEVRVACVDAKALRPRRMPDFMLTILASKELT